MRKQDHYNTCLYYQYFIAIGITVAMALIVLTVFWFLISVVHAHPGGTDSDGCHAVSKNYKYKSGKTLKAGTEHCHATIDKMKFNGKTVLEDPIGKKEKGKK